MLKTFEGLLRIGGIITDEKVASCKKMSNLRLENKKIDPIKMIKIAKIDTLFVTKTAAKPYLLGPHIPIWVIQGITLPG